MIELVLIHHGLTLGNEGKRFIGTTDEPLSSTGVAGLQMREYPMAGLVFSSPMKRCVQTAEILYPGIKATIIDQFRECNYGAFEDKTYFEVKRNPAYYNWLNSAGKMPFPDGEGRAEFIERTMQGLEEILEIMNCKKTKKAILIIHEGTIMGIMSELAFPRGDYYDFQIQNAEGYILHLNEKFLYDLCFSAKTDWANGGNRKNYIKF